MTTTHADDILTVHEHRGWAVWALLTGAHLHRPAGWADRYIDVLQPDSELDERLTVKVMARELREALQLWSGTERARTKLALSLAAGDPVDLRDLLTESFDDQNRTLVGYALSVAARRDF
jgi:hypothetical protein